MQIAKPLPQFAVGAFVVVTKAGRNFSKPGAVLQVLEDTGTDLVLTIPGHGGVLHATHDQVAPAPRSPYGGAPYRRGKTIRAVAPASDPFEPTLED